MRRQIPQEGVPIGGRDHHFRGETVTDLDAVAREGGVVVAIVPGADIGNGLLGDQLPHQGGADDQAVRRRLVGLRVSAEHQDQQYRSRDPVVAAHQEHDHSQGDGRQDPPIGF